MKSCTQQTHAERITALARMFWNREQYAAKREAGVCQFCGEIFHHSYRIAKGGELFTAAPGTDSEQRAMALMANPEPDTFVFPISSCEVMCGADMQSQSEALCDRWREDALKNRQQAERGSAAAAVQTEAYASF